MEADLKAEDRFIELIIRNRGIIKKVVRMYAYNYQDQADLEQEILLQLWKSFQSYKALSKIETWMYRVALNTAIMSFKKRKSILTLLKSVKKDPCIFEYYEDSDQTDYWELLKKCINQLSSIEKAILHLYFEKYNYREIGEIMGYSEKNISVRMFRIKEKLKKSVKIQIQEER